jgi:hypothetical protein
LNDDAGEVDIDSLKSVPFKRGTQCEIRISDTPLRVVHILPDAKLFALKNSKAD